MPQLRVDPLTGQRSIIAGDRAGRPGGELFPPPAESLDPETDPFAEGHEDRTPPEVYALRPGGGAPNSTGWTVRVVPNLYPVFEKNRPCELFFKPGDNHWNARGQELAAVELAALVRARGLLPPRR